MYRGVLKQRNMTVHEFLCYMRRNCQQGCERCFFRDTRIDVSQQKKMCTFGKFDILSDKSLLFILQKVKNIQNGGR